MSGAGLVSLAGGKKDHPPEYPPAPVACFAPEKPLMIGAVRAANEGTDEMAKIGNLQKSPDSFDGIIRTLNFSARFFLELNPEKQSEKSPDYILVARSTVDGENTDIGGARDEVKKVPGKPDVKYLRLWISDPDAPAWAKNLAAFPDDNAPGLFNIVS